MQAEGKGLKDPEAVKAKQKRREEIERQAEAAGRTGETPLKVYNTGCWGWGWKGVWLGHDIVTVQPRLSGPLCPPADRCHTG